MKLCFIDSVGLPYNGNTPLYRGLGGSESAVVYMAKELAKLGIDVTVYNRCDSEGVYDDVKYIDISKIRENHTVFDVLISSRTCVPLIPQEYGHEVWDKLQIDIGVYEAITPLAKYKAIWAHDTFIQGEKFVEILLSSGDIDEVFLLSDWHTHYVTQADHWETNRRDYATLKRRIFNTRNGMVPYIDPPEDVLDKDRNLFIYNSSVSKGLECLIEEVWPRVKNKLPDARLIVVGGYYEGIEELTGEKDEGKEKWKALQTERSAQLDISFTGVITQREINELLTRASFMIYPPNFPETFGISTIEALYYGTIPITSNFGALEQTAIDELSFKTDHQVLSTNYEQIDAFVDLAVRAYSDTYLCSQKRQGCVNVRDIVTWDTVALQWKYHLYERLGLYMNRSEIEKVRKITNKVNRLFGSRHVNHEDKFEYFPTKKERRLTVISPVWNAEQYIENCVRSVAAQLYDNYHHYIVDDCSDDNTVEVANNTIASLDEDIREKFTIVKNKKRVGALENQMTHIDSADEDSVIVLLDGDDWLCPNPDIFNYLNEQYPQNEMTYGSCYSVADRINLIAQEYPRDVRENKTYREYRKHAWGIPYTHLRTFTKELYMRSDRRKLYNSDGEIYKAAGDTALLYMLLEEAFPDKIKAVKRPLVIYNDANPRNDFRINKDEQDRNMGEIVRGEIKKSEAPQSDRPIRILVALPTAKNIETKTFKSIFYQQIPPGCEMFLEFFFGYNIAQIRNLIADYAIKNDYDYLMCVDSDMVLPVDALWRLYHRHVGYVSGIYIQRRIDKKVPEIYFYNEDGYTMRNADVDELSGEDLIESVGTGFGCVLIKVDILKEIGYPQFEYKNALDHSQSLSEDIDFGIKARNLGHILYVDPTVICGHVGEITHEVFKNE